MDLGPTSALEADLNDALILASGLDHPAAFPRVVGEWFFDEDIFTGLTGENGGETVPMVGGGDNDGIDLRILQHTPKILVELRWLSRRRVQGGLGAGCASAVGITEPGDLDVGFAGEHFGEINAASAEAQNPDVDAAVGMLAVQSTRKGKGAG